MSKDNAMSDSEMDLNNLKKELEGIKSSVKKITRTQLSKLSESNLKDMVLNAVDDLNSYLGNQKENLVETREKCRKKIQDNPFVAILGAAVIGSILGMILKK